VTDKALVGQIFLGFTKFPVLNLSSCLCYWHLTADSAEALNCCDMMGDRADILVIHDMIKNCDTPASVLY